MGYWMARAEKAESTLSKLENLKFFEDNPETPESSLVRHAIHDIITEWRLDLKKMQEMRSRSLTKR